MFAGFWESDRTVLRGLGALAALDPALGAVLEAADLLYVLTSFSTYDTLASSGRPPAQITALLQRAARRLLA